MSRFFRRKTRPAARPEPALEDAEQADVAVLVVCDLADKEKAEELARVLQPRPGVSVRMASSPREAEKAAGDAQVALVLVSRELEKNEALVEAVAAKLPNALVPVVVDPHMVLQKEWQDVLSRAMANELYLDFREQGVDAVPDLLRMIAMKARGERPVQEWDVFLSHEWGVHAEAKEIARQLESKHGLKAWLDEKEMSGSIDESMSHGIEGSKVFLVLATKRYMQKVNDGDRADNCLKEFRHAGAQRSDRIVVAALEAEMTRAETVWRGQFQLGLSRQTPVDLCSISDEAIGRLAEAIRQRIEAPLASADLSPWMRDLRANLRPCSSEARAQGKVACFTAGTRSWILDEVGDWYGSERPVFVLVGDGGVGKSVIMAEICSRGGVLGGTSPGNQPLRRKSSRVRSLWRRSNKQQRAPIMVAAYHFFRHDEDKSASPKEALLSIAWQLCESVPGFAEELEQVSLDSPREKTLAEIFQTLLAGPLRKLGPNQARQVVVLDALDECKESGVLFDKVIRPWKEMMPSWLSLVVSTRPEGDIVRGMNNNDLDRKVLELRDEENFRDIELHVEHLLGQEDMRGIVEQKDLKATAKTLAARSEGLFLWASFLPQTLRNAQKAKGDGSLLTKDDIEREDAIPAGLGGMFQEYFERLQNKVGGPGTYAMLLAPIVAAREPLGLKQLAALLELDEEDAGDIVDDARNLLYLGGDGRVALIHKRMADWLSDRKQSGKRLRVNVRKGHERLAAYCRDHCEDDDDFALRHAVYHFVKCGDEAGAFGLLNDFSWVQKVVSVGNDQAQRRATIGALLRDCADLGITYAPECDTPRLLSKSLNALSWDPNELASQVLARFRVHGDDRDPPLVKSLCEPSEPWLRPVRPTLPHPHDPLQHVLKGHSGAVFSVAVEGDSVVSGSEDNTVRIWDAATGALQHVLKDHSRPVMGVAVEGDRVVSGSDDKTVCIWDAATGALQNVLKGHSGAVWSVAVEGDRVVSGSSDNTVRIWDAATGALQHVLEGHSEGVTSVAVEGDRVVSGSYDNTVRIWDAATGALQHVLEGHSGRVKSVAVEGDRVVSGSHYDKTVRIWDAATGALQHVIEDDSGSVFSVAVEGDRVVSGSHDKRVRIWDAATGALQHVLEGHSEEVWSVAVEGDRVVSGSYDGTVRIWNVASGALQHVLEGHSGTVYSMAVEGDRVVSGSHDKTVRIWDAATGALQHVLKGHSSEVLSVAVEGDRVVSGSSDRTVRIWDAATGALQHVLEGHSRAVTSVAVMGDRVVSGSGDDTVRIWDAATGALRHVLKGHSDGVWSVAVEGDRVVSGSYDRTVRIWDAATGALQHVLEGHSKMVMSVAVEGDRVVSGSYDWTVRIWDAATGALQHVLESNSDGVFSVAVEGDRVVSRCKWGKVRVWNAATGDSLDESELNFLRGNFPVAVDDTHVKLSGGVGFSTDNAVLSSTSVRRGEVVVMADTGHTIHFLRVTTP